LRYNTIIPILFTFLFWSCDVPAPTETFDNPLDEEVAEEAGIETPALVFFPDSVVVNTGASATIKIFAMGIENLRGAHLEVNYDQNILSVLSINSGEFFAEASDVIFLPEINQSTGKLDIYTSYVGSDTLTVSGTGCLVTVVFSTISAGQSALTYSTTSEMVDADDVPIVLAGYGTGVIYAE